MPAQELIACAREGSISASPVVPCSRKNVLSVPGEDHARAAFAVEIFLRPRESEPVRPHETHRHRAMVRRQRRTFLAIIATPLAGKRRGRRVDLEHAREDADRLGLHLGAGMPDPQKYQQCNEERGPSIQGVPSRAAE